MDGCFLLNFACLCFDPLVCPNNVHFIPMKWIDTTLKWLEAMEPLREFCRWGSQPGCDCLLSFLPCWEFCSVSLLCQRCHYSTSQGFTSYIASPSCFAGDAALPPCSTEDVSLFSWGCPFDFLLPIWLHRQQQQQLPSGFVVDVALPSGSNPTVLYVPRPYCSSTLGLSHGQHAFWLFASLDYISYFWSHLVKEELCNWAWTKYGAEL